MGTNTPRTRTPAWLPAAGACTCLGALVLLACERPNTSKVHPSNVSNETAAARAGTTATTKRSSANTKTAIPTAASEQKPPAHGTHEIRIDAAPRDLLDQPRSKPAVGIFNAHEHVQSRAMLPGLFRAMNQTGLEQSIILGSPRVTFELGKAGFTHLEENNEEVLAMAAEHPKRLIPFVALNPEAPEAPELLRSYIARGARGIKLYAGHGAVHGGGPFHSMPLSDPRLSTLYTILQSESIPVVFHVNYNRFADEFEAVLNAYPRMKVLCPHYCLTLRFPRRLKSLLSRFPNLWLDISFGYIQFQAEGFLRIHQARDTLRSLIEEFPDRFIFGTDLVVSDHVSKTSEWMSVNINAYRDLLEREQYRFYALEGETPLRGLKLPPELLAGIYRRNLIRWLQEPARDVDVIPVLPAPQPQKLGASPGP